MDIDFEQFWLDKVYNGITELLDSWKWQWFTTLTYPADCNHNIHTTNEMRKWFTRSICIVEQIQLSYFYALCKTGDLFHCHMLR